MKEQSSIIVIGVTGGIAAYKACDVVSEFAKRGEIVQVVMTAHATKFVAPLTFQALSGRPVLTELLEPGDAAAMQHIELQRRAKLLAIIPATANIIAKLAAGIADDALTATALSVTCPLLIAPAMNTQMWNHPLTQRNMKTLRDLGYRVVEPVEGELACKDVGIGKLAPVEDLVRAIDAALRPR